MSIADTCGRSLVGSVRGSGRAPRAGGLACHSRGPSWRPRLGVGGLLSLLVMSAGSACDADTRPHSADDSVASSGLADADVTRA